ncbi:hypothetical protein OG349_11045 [Streptomyces sp. NBC_01317]|uniref:hypothetical protein n=1 Tax=Streptomyces sp. NBC_01317 TaxID=2903822 RepID=UPI002E132F45|nr:hypothetical protein OG349_11045 [Streptomyces sp. NBC_01317]
MAFECGALGRSGGKTALECLHYLLAYLLAEDSDVSPGSIREGEGWAATRIQIARTGEAVIEQYIQVSVGGEIVDIYLESAREMLSDDDLQGRDLMMTTVLSGVTDPVVNDRIMVYALTEWNGVSWDETSGFTVPGSPD